MFKVNNESTGATYFTPFSGVSIVDIKQVNVSSKYWYEKDQGKASLLLSNK